MGLSLGVATADITPDHLPPLCGFAKRCGPTTGVRDRLHTKALFLTDGKTQTILSSNDILGISGSMYRRICNEVSRAGLSQDTAVQVATTHTHSGPATIKLHNSGKMDVKYVSRLQAAIARTAIKSAAETEPVVLQITRAIIPTGGINRRNPNDTIDPEALLLDFRSAKHEGVIASICNYACHPVVLTHENLDVSGDYPAYLQQLVESQTVGPCLFLNGACGDVDPRRSDLNSDDPAAQLGCRVADALLDATPDKIEKVTPLRVFQTTIDLPVQPNTIEKLEARAAEAATAFDMDPQLFQPRLDRLSRRLRENRYPSTLPLTLSLVAFGEAIGILFLPGEVFAKTGLTLKSMSPFQYTMISGFSNGTVGYLPTPEAYAEGGYEPYWAPFFYDFPELSPQVEEVLLGGVRRLFDQAQRAS